MTKQNMELHCQKEINAEKSGKRNMDTTVKIITISDGLEVSECGTSDTSTTENEPREKNKLEEDLILLCENLHGVETKTKMVKQNVYDTPRYQLWVWMHLAKIGMSFFIVTLQVLLTIIIVIAALPYENDEINELNKMESRSKRSLQGEQVYYYAEDESIEVTEYNFRQSLIYFNNIDKSDIFTSSYQKKCYDSDVSFPDDDDDNASMTQQVKKVSKRTKLRQNANRQLFLREDKTFSGANRLLNAPLYTKLKRTWKEIKKKRHVSCEYYFFVTNQVSNQIFAIPNIFLKNLCLLIVEISVFNEEIEKKKGDEDQ